MKLDQEQAVLRRCEMAAAIAMTAVLLLLHTRLLLHAGPLWRDEVSSFHVATTPDLRAFFTSLVLDPFPILFVSLLRVWIALGLGGSDFALRVLGFIVGMSLLGGIWVCAWMMGNDGARRRDHSDEAMSPPLWPLAIFALAPVTLIEGDSLRAYGVGLIGIVLTFGFIWRLTFAPWRTGTVVGAAIAAVWAAQSLYLNWMILFAIVLAGTFVSLRREQSRRATIIFCVGLLAAVSGIPYVHVIRQAHQQVGVEREFQTASEQSNALPLFIRSGRGAWLIASALLVIILVMIISMPSWRRSLFARVKGADDRILFALVVLTVGAMATFALLWTSQVHSARYRLPFTAAAALSLHAIYTVARKNIRLTIAGLIGSVVTAAVFIPTSYHLAGLRKTNCDLAAAAVSQSSTADDFVVVTRFTHAPAFHRYYHGKAAWTSVPAAGADLQHPAYLARPEMLNVGAIKDVLERIESELKAGNKVFLVGRFRASEKDSPVALPSTPQDGGVRKLGAFVQIWRAQMENLLHQHAVEIKRIPISYAQPIDPQEKEDVFVCAGWKD